MKVKFEKDGREVEATIISGAGYNDGYYWEWSATVVFDDVEYSIQNAGSGSGYIPWYSSVSKGGPMKLVSLIQLCENHLDSMGEESSKELAEIVVRLMEEFFERGCEESLEKAGDWGDEIRVDGKEVKEA